MRIQKKRLFSSLSLLLLLVFHTGCFPPAPIAQTSAPIRPTQFYALPFFGGEYIATNTYTPLHSLTPFPTLTPSKTPTSTKTLTPTHTPTLTPTATPTLLPKLNLLFQSCNTGFDILGGLGEVTNAYLTLQNLGNTDAVNVFVSLIANDIEGQHPDQRYQIPYLPPDHEISLKLTVNTKSNKNTVLTVQVGADNALEESLTKEQCSSRIPDNERIKALGVLYKVVKIGTQTQD